MKIFNELTKRELADLTEQQVDAYIDIELASQNIVKPIDIKIDYPEYVRKSDTAPERDITIFEVDGYSFADMETAQKFCNFVGTVSQVTSDYDYNIGSEFRYVKNSFLTTPTISVKKVYSEAKFLACKELLKNINKKDRIEKDKNEEIIDSVINYDAIEQVASNIREKIRLAMRFFVEAKAVAENYSKYFSITNDRESALKTLFTVYNIQNEELKNEITKNTLPN